MSYAAELLTIDVDAEVHKLCERQFAGPAERLVELVRLTVASGAQAVRVSIGVRWATIETLGGDLQEALTGLAIVADLERSSAERHEALVRCEAAGAVALLALLAAPAARVEAHGAHGSWALDLVADRPPGAQRRQVPQAPSIKLAVARRGRRREEIRALARACRYASIPILLGGRRLSHGLITEDCLLEATAESRGLTCKVGLPRTGELCQTTLLVHEIVAKELFGLSPRGHTHLAVVRDDKARSSDGVDLDHANQVVRDLRDDLYQHLRERYPDLSPRDRAAARELLFRCVERGRDARALRGIPMFHRLAGGPVDVATVAAAVRDGTLWAVEPNLARGLAPLDQSGVFILDRRERELLNKVLGVTFLQPPTVERHGLRWRARDLGRRGLRRAVDFCRGALAWLMGSRPLPAALLTLAEQGFLAALRDELSSGRYLLPNLPGHLAPQIHLAFVERGRLPIQARRRGHELRLLVPRRHPHVGEMVRQVERDRWSLYPALAVLFAGYDGYGAHKLEVQGRALAAPSSVHLPAG